MGGKPFRDVTALYVVEVNQREKVEMQRKVSNVPSATFPDRAEEKFPNLPQLSVLQPGLGKEMCENLNTPCRTGKAPFPLRPCPEQPAGRQRSAG